MAFTGRMKNMEKASCDIGLIGLAVMGQNLVLNMANHGFSVGVYNRTTSTTDEFIDSLPTEREDKVLKGTVDRVKGYHTLEEFVGQPLFVRESGRVVLTDAGVLFANQLADILFRQ